MAKGVFRGHKKSKTVQLGDSKFYSIRLQSSAIVKTEEECARQTCLYNEHLSNFCKPL